ncbi:MAG: arginine--tRNA ligase [Acidobacteriota bacterium]|nr:MAG: arginine--tRNA ligase [Acidobacteriota bacterium]
MAFLEFQQKLTDALRAFAAEELGADLDHIAAEIPPKTELGDLAFPVAFELAKVLKQKTGEKQNPRALAEKIAPMLESFDFVGKVSIAGPGYINVYYDRARYLSQSAGRPALADKGGEGEKICVEHTSVNPNKAAHIGHVRNSVLGDTFVRILRAAGHTVEIQNYIDNTGVQVADVVVGFIHLEKMDLDTIKALDARLKTEGTSFDYYCWDLYTKIGIDYQTNESLTEKRAETLHLIEEGDNDVADLADYVATRNVECILDTMERLSIRYDLLPRESEILHLHFWEKAFTMMKEREAIRLETEGKNAGCWVMPFESHEGSDEHETDKILVRSNGTVTYTGKDIAYQMWKLGLLGMDFKYRHFSTYGNGQDVWITTSRDVAADKPVPEFGHASKVYNVIDTRQSYPQEVVKKGVALIFPEKGEEASVHLNYEMVALSPSAAEELGFFLTDEDRSRSFVEMSGRKGLGVKADDLIDRLERDAFAEVQKRHSEITDEEKASIAHEIAVGALRYFLLKFTKNTVVIFDFKEALSFEGETGVYCQYTAVRANSIFRKLEENAVTAAAETIAADLQGVSRVLEGDEGDGIWAVAALAARLEETIAQSVASAEPATLARYTFNLSKAFNLFYHHHRIIDEEDEVKRAVLIAVADSARSALTEALATLGIKVPDRM